MARNVNVQTSNWRATGSNVSVPQFSQNVSVQWIDDAGVSHTWSGLIKFPDILITMYGANQSWTVEQMQNLIFQFGRKQLGIDT